MKSGIAIGKFAGEVFDQSTYIVSHLGRGLDGGDFFFIFRGKDHRSGDIMNAEGCIVQGDCWHIDVVAIVEVGRKDRTSGSLDILIPVLRNSPSPSINPCTCPTITLQHCHNLTYRHRENTSASRVLHTSNLADRHGIHRACISALIQQYSMHWTSLGSVP